ncbi:MAG: helix-hairpin-helix domain-containing protein [Candidatus Altiarchaeota archaeon]|nr:helix-hairpin-helix domain-containing protein [Candidatus Altiarchaeota archaeon]
MTLLEKVQALGAAGKWDTCASSASPRKVQGGDRIGNVAASGICHSFTENGRCVSLFKTLMNNDCSYDCKYCQNSAYCQKKTYAYEPEELAKVFMHLYLGNYVEGLFLSSAVHQDPDESTMRMLDAVNLIRNKFNFQGYVHFKILPGTGKDLVKQAAVVSDRLSINIEAPSKSRLAEVTGIKSYDNDIILRQKWIREEKIPSGQTTQMVVGGSGESDIEILKAAEWEYDTMKLRRVYYSAFTPIPDTPMEKAEKTPYEREHQLYQVDFMMRKYDIRLDEFRDILEDGNLPKGDPKMHLAERFFDQPVDVNNASYEELIRVPGIGPQSAYRMTELRKNGVKLTKRSELRSIGVVLKRAEPFLKINGMTQRRIIDYAQ